MTGRIRSKIARGSGEIAILALLAVQPLYGFEIAKQIGERTGGTLKFTLASLSVAIRDGEAWLGGGTLAGEPGRPRPPLLSPHRERAQTAGASAPGVAGVFPCTGQPGRSELCLTGRNLLRSN